MKITIERDLGDEKAETLVVTDVVEFAIVGTRVEKGLYASAFLHSHRAHENDACRLIGQMAEQQERLRRITTNAGG